MSSRCITSSSRKQHLDWIKIDPHKCGAVPTPSSSCTTPIIAQPLRKIDLRIMESTLTLVPLLPHTVTATAQDRPVQSGTHALCRPHSLMFAQPLRKIDLRKYSSVSPTAFGLPSRKGGKKRIVVFRTAGAILGERGGTSG